MRSARVAALSVLVAFGASAGCIGQEPQQPLTFPDRGQFVNDGVSELLEKRCGAMDCHGSVARPLRLYSQNGLRLETSKDGPRVQIPTTAEERSANYLSVIGLEPEELSTSVATGAEYRDFMLFKKPLDDSGGGVVHKGGPVLAESDPGWECLRSWVAGQANKDRCAEGAAANDLPAP